MRTSLSWTSNQDGTKGADGAFAKTDGAFAKTDGAFAKTDGAFAKSNLLVGAQSLI